MSTREETKAGRGSSEDIRCECGQLLARWHPNGIEIKCKRCRRIVMIPYRKIEGTPPPGLARS